jgi:hypothetical protein
LLELPEKVLKTKEGEITACMIAQIAGAAFSEKQNLPLLRGSARHERPLLELPEKVLKTKEEEIAK